MKNMEYANRSISFFFILQKALYHKAFWLSGIKDKFHCG